MEDEARGPESNFAFTTDLSLDKMSVFSRVLVVERFCSMAFLLFLFDAQKVNAVRFCSRKRMGEVPHSKKPPVGHGW